MTQMDNQDFSYLQFFVELVNELEIRIPENKNQWGVLTLSPYLFPCRSLGQPGPNHYHITLYPYPFPPLHLGSLFCLYSGFEKLKSDTTLSLRITVTNTKLVNGTDLPSLPQTTQVQLADTYLCFCTSNFS